MSTLHTNDLERTARRRAGMKLGWYIHAGLYLAVNLGLGAAALASGSRWVMFPAFGWGIGVAIHGVVVYLRTSGAYDGLVARERRLLAAEHDPW